MKALEHLIEHDDQSAIFLSEYLLDLNSGAGFLSGLNDLDQARIRKAGSRRLIKKGEGLFFQGDAHTGIWIVEKGRMRTFYAAPTGRELTLAYWTPGHFVGGPEVFGRGRHVWSGDALEDCELLFLSGMALRDLVEAIPAVALKIIDGLVAKGNCYSALIQMLGTRSVSERLEQLLVILASTHGRHDGDTILIDRSITYEQVASIVGASRQWVTQSLDKLQKEGVLEISRRQITIFDIDRLSEGQ
ncbi:MAG: CRP/FNR family cyclic AMP-dependent transcriptional regulator [Gammaproteobacteria bacterium]|jgi:CRP/FNR family cyclic AMP-dependent transcriptional regulator